MDISAHRPRPLGRNDTSQARLRMRRSLPWDEDWDIMHVTCQDGRIIFQL